MNIIAAVVDLLYGDRETGSPDPGRNIEDRGDSQHVTVYSPRQDVRVSFNENNKGVSELHSTDQKSRDKK